MLNMNNVAYTEEYKIRRKKSIDAFSNAKLIEEKKIIISEKYYLKRKKTAHEHTFGIAENVLFDSYDKQLYCFTDIQPDSEFYTLIQHNDGNEYLIFRCDIFGYSVLNLSTMEDFHYFPESSFYGEETIMWVKPYYNKTNNMIAVAGCIWGGPYEVLIADFSNPMKSCGQINIRDMEGYQSCFECEIDFVGWDNTDMLLDFSTDSNLPERILIHENEYIKWIKNNDNNKMGNFLYMT